MSELASYSLVKVFGVCVNCDRKATTVLYVVVLGLFSQAHCVNSRGFFSPCDRRTNRKKMSKSFRGGTNICCAALTAHLQFLVKTSAWYSCNQSYSSSLMLLYIQGAFRRRWNTPRFNTTATQHS